MNNNSRMPHVAMAWTKQPTPWQQPH
jgi:hypothetical protein